MIRIKRAGLPLGGACFAKGDSYSIAPFLEKELLSQYMKEKYL